jgi:hypothetical protein
MVKELPALVVCPIPIAVGVVPADAHGIYELALERARAACAPSVWSLAQRVCTN